MEQRQHQRSLHFQIHSMKKTYFYGLVLLAALSFSACRKEDKIPPEITMNGSANIQLTLGDSFTDPGATAHDNKNGDLTHLINVSGGVNPDQTGNYYLTYKVSDFSGNEAEKTRFVNVKNTAAQFGGTYSVKDSVWAGSVITYQEQVKVSSTVNDRLSVSFFGGNINGAVYFELLSNQTLIHVPSQTLICGNPPQQKTFQSINPGSILTNPLKFSIDYTVTTTSGTTTITSTYTKIN
jgi:hypothetical protein